MDAVTGIGNGRMAVVLYKYTYLLNLNLDLLLYWFYRCALPRAVSAATAVASLYYLLLVLWPLGLILVLVLATYKRCTYNV